jgi:ribosomal protein S18 acetylase RimI-like enzyme
MEIRDARPQDLRAIEALTKRTRFTSAPLWRWKAHLAGEGFVVVEIDDRIEGMLLATADESPVAWVRMAAVSDELDVLEWINASLPPILDHLRGQQVRELAWMDHDQWAEVSLQSYGFRPRTEVITLHKTDRKMPEIQRPLVALRPVSDADFSVIAAIDRKAFAPTWWRSEASMRRRGATTSRFTVAEHGDDVIGYVEREAHPPMAHLNRIAVDPLQQGQGIGAVLLKHALVSLWRQGVETVSLNTQRSNRRSRRLYDRFGFQASGDSATVWVLRL